MTEKGLDYYMSLPYVIEIYPDIDGGFTASVRDLPGCLTCADTWEELKHRIDEVKWLWLEVAIEDGNMSIPEPKPIIEKDTL